MNNYLKKIFSVLNNSILSDQTKKTLKLTKNFSNQQLSETSIVHQLNKIFTTMIRVRLNETEKKVSISLRCKVTDTLERDFNLNRSMDEPISSTFQKLYANYEKQVRIKDSRSTKKQKKDDHEMVDTNTKSEEEVPLYLFDFENNKIPSDTPNKEAWKDKYSFKLLDQYFEVSVNLPCIKKMSISKLLIAGMSGVVKLEFDAEENLIETLSQNSKYMWYYSEKAYEREEIGKNTKDNVEWILMEEGFNVRACKLHDCTENRFIKVVCIPSDGKRDGQAFEAISKETVMKKIELMDLPMTERHMMTKEYLKSDKLRVMTYNVLANCYSDTTMAKEELFKHCPPEYLDFRYRRLLLAHEIKNYKSDVIFLQECETDFIEEDLKANMANYHHLIRPKTGSKEGSGTMFRTDRFRFVKSHDIVITEELKTNPTLESLWRNITANKEFCKEINERNTVFQVTQVESLEHPGKHFLLANTHLFFHPSADFTRLLQAIVCIKYIEKLKFSLVSSDSNVKEASILFGGDFNSDPPSHAFQYIFTQSIPFYNLTEEEKKFVNDNNCEELLHSLGLSAYADFPYTNYTVGFNGILDYVFYETSAFELEKVIPIPSLEKVQENIAMPSKLLPSDHCALVFDLKMK